MATLTAERSSTPRFFIAFIAAVGLSFIAGEKVGIRLAGNGVTPAPASIVTAGGAPVDRAASGFDGAAPLQGETTEGIGADCNTNYR
jgi:hypothetical protein